MKSVVAAPSWTSPSLWILPVSLRIRSVVVVLPASTWAKMPMFRYLLSSCFISRSVDGLWGVSARVRGAHAPEIGRPVPTTLWRIGKQTRGDGPTRVTKR